MKKSLADIFKMICSVPYTKAGDDVDYAVIRDDENRAIFLLFQESESRRDWQVNFNFPAKVYKHQENKFYVARGWGEAYKSANDKIMEKLLEVYTDYKYDLWICGWSYGGALAQLAAEDVHYRYGLHPTVVTFGSPKVLWGSKTQEYFKKCCLYVENVQHINDCVPLLPPFPGYKVINPYQIGKKFSIRGLCDPCVYHCIYGEESLY